ncbi:MAG: threonine ammonia-lyase [Nitriliruptorales bacterium]|nr:threonine ammonia-lyase [Nitriliruptorales bacterium]
MDLVTIEEIRAAANRMADRINPTPLEYSRVLSGLAGADVRLKCENLQRTGSFKIRGAFNRIAGLTDDERARGVIAASAGNHAQGVALAGQWLDTAVTVFMPSDASLPKVEATRAYGATVTLEGATFNDALALAEQAVDDTGAVMIHPFDNEDVIAGQGTVGLELLDQVPDVSSVIVPVGGGGLISGVAACLKAEKPAVRVIGVQAAGSACFGPSLAAGEPLDLPTADTIADGIAVKRPGDLNLVHVERFVDDMVTVEDAQIARALVLLLERAKLVVEPAGAAAVAAVLDGVADREDGPVVCLLSGGNIDPLLLQHLVTSGLTAEGRFATITTRVPDRPGELARLLASVADLAANVVSVEHHRLSGDLRLGTVEVQLELETRGPSHVAEALAALRDGGWPVEED